MLFMKSNILILIVLFLIYSNAYSNDEKSFDYKSIQGISLGGGGYLEVMRAGGFFEFGFNLYSKESFDLRNAIKIGGSTSLYNELFFTLSERVSVGFTKPITSTFALRRYILIEYSFSFFKNETKKNFINGPYVMDIGIGSGHDFIIDSSAYFIEMSVGYIFITKGKMKDVLKLKSIRGTITIGGRKYF